ncbi:hypothetical protein BT67DRAFT_497117 [Trichocladium antarcticum]|uniref:Uncharacterized protein n=1 Tax=Trichocladium antarcticum TaxID=1450529 RepID=A0AAN6UM08_9PEZI|nr:hypothetical protein BT67DRAFT_497117 [Trichocladium antarcticum]
MEREEHGLKRTCEDLRLTLDSRTRELSQSQELYSKLKQRVLLNQTQNLAPGVSRSRTPVQGGGPFDAGRGHSQSQLPRPVLPPGTTRATAAASYFPASPGYPKSHSGPSTLVEWNKPAISQPDVPATPSNHLSLRNPNTLAFTSTPRAGVGTATSLPGSGRFRQTTSHPEAHVAGSQRSFSGPNLGLRPLHGAGDLDLSRPSLGVPHAIHGPSRVSPRSAERQTSQHFELPRTILRRP